MVLLLTFLRFQVLLSLNPIEVTECFHLLPSVCFAIRSPGDSPPPFPSLPCSHGPAMTILQATLLTRYCGASPLFLQCCLPFHVYGPRSAALPFIRKAFRIRPCSAKPT